MEHTQVQKPPHIAMVPTPGMGHLIPLVELAKKLVLHHHFFVTFIIPTDGSPIKSQKAVLESLPNAISYIFLPPVSFDDLPKDVRPETLIVLTLTRSLPALRDSFKVLAESTRLVALVADLFGVDAFDVAKEFGALSYIFFPTNALSLSLMFHIPELDETYSCEYKELPEPVKLPGCVPVQGIDILDPIQDKKNDTYKRVLHVAKRYPFADGIMVNSFMDLEPSALKALMEGAKEGKPPVYPIGPLIQSGLSGGVDGSECLNWLDKQPERSVLYVSFGSGGTLTQEQLNELALGLELSGQRFLWVVRSPHENASANYFSVQSFKDPLDFLPKGFLERTKEVGLVVPSWAPQAQVLSHGSTGGFLSHCGWNSILESIVHGVPIIAWPLYAEQRMNAVLLSDDLKVALRVKVNDKGLVGHKDIANYARGLIEGEEGKLLRNKMKELKDSAAKALSQDGSSTKSLAEVTQLWKSHKNNLLLAIK